MTIDCMEAKVMMISREVLVTILSTQEMETMRLKETKALIQLMQVKEMIL